MAIELNIVNLAFRPLSDEGTDDVDLGDEELEDDEDGDSDAGDADADGDGADEPIPSGELEG